LFGAHADFVGRMGKKVNPRSSLSFVHFPFVGLRWPAGFYSLHFLYYLSRHLICVLCVCVWGNTSGKSPCGIDTKSLFFFLIFFQINSLRIGHTLLCRLILIWLDRKSGIFKCSHFISRFQFDKKKKETIWLKIWMTIKMGTRTISTIGKGED
jgi:hypothetical protein